MRITALTKQALSSLHQLDQLCFPKAWGIANWQITLDQDIAYGIVNPHDHNLIGMYCLKITYMEAELQKICIHPHYQRQGLGSQLMKHIIATVQQYHCESLFLEVRDTNLGAVNFYKSFQFEQVGYRPNYYQDPIVQGAIIMKKVITENVDK